MHQHTITLNALIISIVPLHNQLDRFKIEIKITVQIFFNMRTCGYIPVGVGV
jgi:hypothetical protein